MESGCFDCGGCRSQRMMAYPEGNFNRSVFKSMGFTNESLAKPLIGIANAWSEAVPGHFNLRQLADYVKRGICAAGGTTATTRVMPCATQPAAPVSTSA